ncbi:MAG TPA: ATP-binding protein [Methanocorpusculum sp.]|nr:ATP-binding protein [Methanocorpusculum sp.]HJJ59520.1 ATP-binding protein [Methanocorpusculum sp.]
MKPESGLIEYKREIPSAHDKLEKEVVAFLNSSGGSICFGVDNNGSVTGVEDPDELQLKLKDRIKNNISPEALDYCSLSVEEQEGKYLVILKIQSGWKKPYYLNKYGMTAKGCFYRIGSSVEPMSVSRIESLLSKRVRCSLKKHPVSVQNAYISAAAYLLSVEKQNIK